MPARQSTSASTPASLINRHEVLRRTGLAQLAAPMRAMHRAHRRWTLGAGVLRRLVAAQTDGRVPPLARRLPIGPRIASISARYRPYSLAPASTLRRRFGGGIADSNACRSRPTMRARPPGQSRIDSPSRRDRA